MQGRADVRQAVLCEPAMEADWLQERTMLRV